jgi:phosphoribosylformylglycinamidine cyclo-ligase
VGGFSGLFDLKELEGYKLVAATDGVGTKLKLAFLTGKHDTIGIDLVAMCANDIITCGAKPLFFLDYYASSRLDLKISREILKGIFEGCRQARMTLLGGETAEMPGFYKKGEYDLAGFAVGITKTDEIINGSEISDGDIVLGLPSSGLHSNGFSLVRKVFGKNLKKYAKKLLTPTKIYVKDILKLQSALQKKNHKILGLAHITGGGLIENIGRILPKKVSAKLNSKYWKVPKILETIKSAGKVPDSDMWRTFNMGIGMVMILKSSTVTDALKVLPNAKVIGGVISGNQRVIIK